MYTIGQAAKATGKSKSTISAYIKRGKIPAKKNEDSSYTIDPTELHRVFPPVASENGSEPQSNDTEPISLVLHNQKLQGEIKLLREQLTNKDRVIDSLRRNLAQAEEQRSLALTLVKWQEHQPAPVSPPRKGLRGFLHSLIGL
jgi:Helix-turn-helix domain